MSYANQHSNILRYIRRIDPQRQTMRVFRQAIYLAAEEDYNEEFFVTVYNPEFRRRRRQGRDRCTAAAEASRSLFHMGYRAHLGPNPSLGRIYFSLMEENSEDELEEEEEEERQQNNRRQDLIDADPNLFRWGGAPCA
jgi:hypothetical protein